MPTENLRKVIKSEFLARGWTWVGFKKKGASGGSSTSAPLISLPWEPAEGRGVGIRGRGIGGW